MTTYMMPGTGTIKLVTDRAELITLDVPFEVLAVVVIKSGDNCEHILPITLVQEIVRAFEARKPA